MPDDGLQAAGKREPLHFEFARSIADVKETAHVWLKQHTQEVSIIGVCPQMNHDLHAVDRAPYCILLAEIANDIVMQFGAGMAGETAHCVASLHQSLGYDAANCTCGACH
jgi:hypothetical protein